MKTVADEPTPKPELDLSTVECVEVRGGDVVFAALANAAAHDHTDAPVAVTDGGSDSGTLAAGLEPGRPPCKVCGAASADGIHIDHDDDCWAGGERERKKAEKWETFRRETIEQDARYRRDCEADR